MNDGGLNVPAADWRDALNLDRELSLEVMTTRFRKEAFLEVSVGVIGLIAAHFFTSRFTIQYTDGGSLKMGASPYSFYWTVNIPSIFDFTRAGNENPLPLAIAAFLPLLAIAFPALVWFLMYRFGSLKLDRIRAMTIGFFVFAGLPLFTYLIFVIFPFVQADDKAYSSEIADCMMPDSAKMLRFGNDSGRFECKIGIFEGPVRIYTPQGGLAYEANYVNGRLNGQVISYHDDGNILTTTTFVNGVEEGPEAWYNEDGTLAGYNLNEHGRWKGVYFQMPEQLPWHGDEYDQFSIKGQQILCNQQGNAQLTGRSFSCLNGVLNGEFIRYRSPGVVWYQAQFDNGTLDGLYEDFTKGKAYLEYHQGKLVGKAEEYFENGLLAYQGQYTNGFQDGVFQRYDSAGTLVSEVVFEAGSLTRINVDK